MCKLNLLCKQEDGQCSCNNKNLRVIESQKPHNSLLFSILSFIKDQPEIINGLSESSKVPASKLMASMSKIDHTFEAISSPQNSDSTVDEMNELHVNVLSDLPSKLSVGRCFPLMAEVVDQNLSKANLDTTVTFQVAIVCKITGTDLAVLGEVETSGLALFRKIVVHEKIDNCELVVRVKDRNDIRKFSQDVEVKSKKSKEKPIKRMKTGEISA